MRTVKSRFAATAFVLALLPACDDGGPQEPVPLPGPAGPAAPDGPGQPAAPEQPGAPETPGQPETRAWQLTVTRPADTEGPRMAEVILRHGEGLRFLEAQPGLAASRARKQVVVQERPGGQVRVVVFSGGNLEQLDTGPLASLSFSRSGEGPETLEILYERSAFAPALLYPRPETLQLEPLEEARP